jgi:flavin reductase (DIM6/NTAB) family NADH-FMN oxidoreductase RutF/rubredoxin
MDNKALYNISYGVFLMSSRADDKDNACITNTCMQVASAPVRIAVSVLNSNYTCELIKKSKKFTLSVLDNTCTFETIKHFGYQSGRKVDKFKDIILPRDSGGICYLGWQTCSVISADVTDEINLGTHTLFIATISDAFVLSDNKPLTYSDYQKKIKPANKQIDSNRKIKGYRCKICGYEYIGSELPNDFICPLCGHSIEDFEPIYEN